GARPVALDLSSEQLATARALQREFGLVFPLVQASAEAVPVAGERFDLVISEYGECLWADPYRWVPEAARLLRPGGHLAFHRGGGADRAASCGGRDLALSVRAPRLSASLAVRGDLEGQAPRLT